MRHSQIDLTMNVYTDPKLLDVYGALDSLPSLDLDSSPSTEHQTMRATGTHDATAFAGATAKSFVAPTVAPTTDFRGHSASFPVIASGNAERQTGRRADDENLTKPSEKALLAEFANKASEVGVTRRR